MFWKMCEIQTPLFGLLKSFAHYHDGHEEPVSLAGAFVLEIKMHICTLPNPAHIGIMY